MGNLISLLHISLDGFCAGPKGEMDWVGARMDDELWENVTALLSAVDGAIFGRVTYQDFENYWPAAGTNPSINANEIAFARWIENVPKTVISRTLKNATWKNTELIAKNIDTEIAKKKKQQGRDLVIFGSPRLTATLIGLSLIDELRIYIHPILLGEGKPLLENLKAGHEVKLMDSKILRSGVVSLRYRDSG